MHLACSRKRHFDACARLTLRSAHHVISRNFKSTRKSARRMKTRRFLEIYSAHPSLWKIKSKECTNRNLRNNAYDDLVEYCKKIGFDSANRDFVSKKIQSLRGAFRKEIKKVIDSGKKSGSGQDDLYKPTLWYYDLLLFTKDQEIPANSLSNMDDYEEPDHDATDEDATRFHRTPADEEIPISSPTEKEDKENRKPCARKRKNLEATQIDFLNVCSDVLKKNTGMLNMSEYDALGVNFARKLNKMDKIQAIYAESIIHQVLRMGALNELSSNTDICNNQCRNAVFYSDLPPDSSHNVNPVERQNDSILNEFSTNPNPDPDPEPEPPIVSNPSANPLQPSIVLNANKSSSFQIESTVKQFYESGFQ